MICLRTGFHARLENRGEWLYGDAFVLGESSSLVVSLPRLALDRTPCPLVLRICEISREPISPVAHLTVAEEEHWFDRDSMFEINSTMIVLPRRWAWHGHEGVSSLLLARTNPVHQPCDVCGEPVLVNAVSPSECFCSSECANGDEKP